MTACPRKLIIAIAVITIFNCVAIAQNEPLKSISYRLSMSRHVASLEVTIAVELPDQLKATPLQFQMAKRSPGREMQLPHKRP